MEIYWDKCLILPIWEKVIESWAVLGWWGVVLNFYREHGEIVRGERVVVVVVPSLVGLTLVGLC